VKRTEREKENNNDDQEQAPLEVQIENIDPEQTVSPWSKNSKGVDQGLRTA
jgi:hypothetical protein